MATRNVRRRNYRENERSFWRDKEKRRAFLLSLLLHLGGIFLIIYAYVTPTPLEPENFIVLELGPSEQADTNDAAAAADPAPQAAEPEVASEAAGAPRTPTAAPTPEASAAPQAQTQPAQDPTPAAPPAPQASVPAPRAEPLDLPPQEAAATLPEVEEVELEPQPLAEAIPVPRPSAAANVPEARSVAATPRVQVAARVAVPEPSAQVAVAAEQSVPTPQAQASVAAARPVPTPDVSASVPERAIPQPQAQASVPSAQSVPTPQVAVAVPTPRALAVTPGVQVAEAESIPSPQVTVAAEVPETPSQAAETAEASQSGDQAAQREVDAVGGNAPDTGQTQVQDAAQADNAGAASAPEALSAPPAGAPASRTPYEVRRTQPIAVVLDNALGYPQTGLREASAVFEMPVEGGLTRLMSVYNNPNSTPREVGPIRSAREYFVAAASAMDGTLVHVGGSPSALSDIARGRTTLDALEQSEPFFVASSQRAPYSTYASGSALRQAIARLELDASRVLRGSAYRPADNAPGAASVSVNYSADYSSGFRYVSSLGQYRWLRNGADASDAGGEDVLVDAVVTAQVTAFPYPGDPEGRLYLPYSGGDATLFLRGKEIPGTWSPRDGFSFFAEDGEAIDLAPYKHWILFAPEYAEVTTG